MSNKNFDWAICDAMSNFNSKNIDIGILVIPKSYEGNFY